MWAKKNHCRWQIWIIHHLNLLGWNICWRYSSWWRETRWQIDQCSTMIRYALQHDLRESSHHTSLYINDLSSTTCNPLLIMLNVNPRNLWSVYLQWLLQCNHFVLCGIPHSKKSSSVPILKNIDANGMTNSLYYDKSHRFLICFQAIYTIQ